MLDGKFNATLRRCYACKDYRQILENRGLMAFMSKKGDCCDNAPMESFFGSPMESFFGSNVSTRPGLATRKESRAALFEYIEVFYNRWRLHSGGGYRTPAQTYAELTAMVA